MSSINKAKEEAPKTTTGLDNYINTTAAAARRLQQSDNISHDQYSPGPIVLVSSSSPAAHQQPQQQLSRYESQKRRDWNTFCQYLKNLQRPSAPVPLSQCTSAHVLDFMRYLDQFGKTKVHLHPCPFFGQPDPSGPCACPLRQAWGSLDALIGRLRAAYEENGGLPETNPFAAGTIRVYLREVRDSQAKARGVPYKKKKKKRRTASSSMSNPTNATRSLPSDHYHHHHASASAPPLEAARHHHGHGHGHGHGHPTQFPFSN